MKLLWLSHFIPYPPRGGSRQRSYNLIRHISARYETHLVALNMQGETKERAAEYAGELRKHCAEVQIWEPPYRWRGARSSSAKLSGGLTDGEHFGSCGSIRLEQACESRDTL
jgi:hypothetical protein